MQRYLRLLISGGEQTASRISRVIPLQFGSMAPSEWFVIFLCDSDDVIVLLMLLWGERPSSPTRVAACVLLNKSLISESVLDL